MRKVTAIITDYYPSAVAFVNKEFNNIKKFNRHQGIFELEDGRLLVIVTDRQSTLAWEFTDYLIDPSYESLEEAVRKRIRGLLK